MMMTSSFITAISLLVFIHMHPYLCLILILPMETLLKFLAMPICSIIESAPSFRYLESFVESYGGAALDLVKRLLRFESLWSSNKIL